MSQAASSIAQSSPRPAAQSQSHGSYRAFDGSDGGDGSAFAKLLAAAGGSQSGQAQSGKTDGTSGNGPANAASTPDLKDALAAMSGSEDTPDINEVGDLVDALSTTLQSVIAELKAGKTPSADTLDQINKAVDILSKLTGGKSGAKNDGTDTDPLAGLMAVIDQLQPVITPTGTADAAQSGSTATGGAAAKFENKLARLASLLDGLSKTADATPEATQQSDFSKLMSDAKALADKLQTALTSTTASQTTASSTTSAAASTQASPATLIAQANGQKPQTDPAADDKTKTADKTEGTNPGTTDAKTSAARAAASQIVGAATATDANDNKAGTNQGGSNATSAIAGASLHAAGSTTVLQSGTPGQTAQQAQTLNLPGIAYEIARQANAGNSHFSIRLDPPEMGRIDVKLNINAGGQVHAHLTVERADTLDLLQRDARGLERALSQAGLDTGRTNLEFSLKQNPFAGQGQGFGQGQQNNPAPWSADTETAAETTDPAPIQQIYRGFATPGGVNLLA